MYKIYLQLLPFIIVDYPSNFQCNKTICYNDIIIILSKDIA